jgi:hypothetical protein
VVVLGRDFSISKWVADFCCFRRKLRGKCRRSAQEKWLPVMTKSTKMGRQAVGSETTIEDTQPCVPSQVLQFE